MGKDNNISNNRGEVSSTHGDSLSVPAKRASTALSSNFDPALIETICWAPRVAVFHKILSEEECKHIIDLGKEKVTRSEVVVKVGEKGVHSGRTSYGVFMDGKNDPVMQKLTALIAEWTQLPAQNGEPYYLLRYEVGQEYKPHNDFFARDDAGSRYIGTAGQRIATVLTYLCSPDEGGETIFPNADGGLVKVNATAGDAVLFWSATPEGVEDPKSLHGGNPVIKGTKWALTKWIRENSF